MLVHRITPFARFIMVILLYSLHGNLGAYIPEQACEIHYQPGSVTIGGIVPTYYSDEIACDGAYWVPLISMVESMTYAIHLVNQWQYILQNVSLGYEIRNNCGDEDVTVWSVLTMVSPSANVDYEKTCSKQRQESGKIIGIIGTGRSSTSLLAAKVTSVYNVPMISYYATSDELSNTDRFPFFLRTVPPDKFQVGAVIDLLLHYNWKYIALFYSIDSYGVHGARQIQTMAENLDICIAINLPVSNAPSETEIKDIADKLLENEKVTVIVIFSLWRPAFGVQQAILEHNIRRRFTFVGSDGWGGDLVNPGGTNELLHGSLFIRQYEQPIKEFRDYYKELSNNQDLSSEWYQNMLHWIGEENECSDWTSCPLPESSMEMQVINAVFAFAIALDNSIKSNCVDNNLCDEAIEGNTYLGHLLNVSFDGPGGYFTFDENGDTSGKYLIKSWQPVDGMYNMVDVGVWDPDDTEYRLHIDEDIIEWNGDIGDIPESLCFELCGPNEISIPLKKKCCWGCQSCADHAIVVNASSCEECSLFEWPNGNFTECLPIYPDYVSIRNPIILAIVGISSVGILLCFLVIVGIWVYRHHQLIKATSRELSCVNLIGLTMACVASLLTVLRPSAFSCSISDICISLSFSFIFAPILFKVNRIWRIFQAGSKSVQRPRFVSPKQQLVLTSATILGQAIIAALSSLFGPSTPTILIPAQRQPILGIYCQLSTGFITSCIYNLLLVITCCYFAFRARKVPSNYNESKFIAISVYSTLVVCLAAVPVYSTAVDVNQMVATLCVALLLNSYLTLLCIYLPKLYAIHFAGDELSIETWRTWTENRNSVHAIQIQSIQNQSSST
ncbi:metabotropic glutamate receptor 2-like [Amphiura filiformis]|uniref:metabotropic glutamate receptor 2-like n=1 Tax=Amphiura filiformis TaxID=82378 RepID=UPI003B2274AA